MKIYICTNLLIIFYTYGCQQLPLENTFPPLLVINESSYDQFSYQDTNCDFLDPNQLIYIDNLNFFKDNNFSNFTHIMATDAPMHEENKIDSLSNSASIKTEPKKKRQRLLVHEMTEEQKQHVRLQAKKNREKRKQHDLARIEYSNNLKKQNNMLKEEIKLLNITLLSLIKKIDESQKHLPDSSIF